MRYVVLDLEATCWHKPMDRSRMEIIEIGAVYLESAVGPVSKEFAEFVKPVMEPVLSDFCQRLTTITQSQVDGADYYPEVLLRFVNWIGQETFTLCCWGSYDLDQLRSDCLRHKIELPRSFERHVNLKKEFARLMNVKPCGMSAALKILGLPLEGTHHRGIDDAKNIAKIAQIILPMLEAAPCR